MHKSKGKEFDNVFILLNNYPLNTEEKKRVLYVAMTRAKRLLFIHTNSISFNIDDIPNITLNQNNNEFNSPKRIIFELGMKDIWLGFFKKDFVIENVKKLTSGERLYPSEFDKLVYKNNDKKQILKFSRAFESHLSSFEDSGYVFKKAFALHIVIWYDEETDKSFRVVLPQLIFEKNDEFLE